MPTLRELRRAAADLVAPYDLLTAGAESPAGVWSGTAIDGSRRRVVSSDLASLDATGFASEAPADALRNQWLLLLVTPPEQRRVPEGSYNGFARVEETLVGASAPALLEVGTVDVERPFSAVVPAGTPFELHGVPPLRAGRSAGIHAAVNRALRVILREDTVVVPAVPGELTLDVTASFPWLRNVSLFRDCHWPTTDPGGTDTYAIPGARLRFDADRALLVPRATASAGQGFPVRVLRPLATWIKPAGGAWGESTVGLVADDDACLGETDSIALVAAYHVARAEAAACSVGSPEQGWWAGRAASCAASSPFLHDQQTRRSLDGPGFPDNYSPLGPVRGRWGAPFGRP